jgi:1-acyl-sn-glycerol-3-phosphate acyltransferase
VAHPTHGGSRAARFPAGVPVDPRALVPRLLLGYAGFLARYHRHRIRHLERLEHVLRTGRRIVLVGNHVLDLADPLLFVAALVRRYRRAPHFIGHENIIFHVPGLRELATGWGVIPSRRMEEAADALERDGLLMLFPGAGTEAVLRRFRDEPYRLKWEGREGFLRLALAHDAEVLFVGAVGTEEMYYQSRIPTPDWILALFNAGDPTRYHGAPLTFGLLGPHLLPATFPLPVQLTHDVSPPLDLGDREEARCDPAALDALHARVWAECQAFLDAAVARREREAPCTDRLVRGVERVLQVIGV